MHNLFKKLTLFGVIIIMITAFACGGRFEGNKYGDDRMLHMDFTVFDCTEEYELTVMTDEWLSVGISTVKGSLSVRICAENGEEVYSGNDLTCEEFSVAVPEDGKYTVFITGESAKGEINFVIEPQDSGEEE